MPDKLSDQLSVKMLDEMTDETTDPGSLRPQELEAVYAISRAVTQSGDVDSALDTIIGLTRPVFIFDNMVVYVAREGKNLEPMYARVIGRGKTAGGDIAWGEAVANEVYASGQTLVHQERLDGWENDRLRIRYMLGLPLRSGNEVRGALIFGRFGSPVYTSDQIHLAEFIATHISQLLRRQELVERVASLEAERRLQQLQDNFIAMVSHELVTPLGFIKGYATTLLRSDAEWDEETRREFLSIIDEEADRLRELIDNLLDSSRLQAGTLRMQIQSVRLDTLLREVAQRAATRFESMSIQLDLEPNVVVQADPTRLVQVLDNLLSNASKYAPDSPISISLCIEDDRCQISVKDQGPGIAPGYKERLFERFYRVPEASASAHGTGLGLFICREIVNAHGGEITVNSTLGQGTTFNVILPCQRRPPGEGQLSKENQP